MPHFDSTCDECGSHFDPAATQMAKLCAECAHHLYGYPSCEHDWRIGADASRRCAKCGWNGTYSKYLRSLLART